MKIIPLLDTTAPGVTVGRHSIWAPALGIKVPFQWGGLITKYGHVEGRYAVEETLPHELAILRALAAEDMAPPVGDLVFVETLISEHTGAWHADPVGAWGYEIADANTLPPGRFSIEHMRQLPIAGSPGAWGDVEKPGNVVNGYLVDVRRSAWDMLRWTRDLPIMWPPKTDVAALAADVHRRCQFPRREREHAYQDFHIGGSWQRGERRVVERAALLGFAPELGESVLEIGCQSGGFLQFAWLRTREMSRIAGVELDPDYIDCARRLARHAGANLCIRQLDAVAERDALLAWVRAYFPGGVDHLLLLSMEKHLGDGPMFALVDAIGARRTYIETNAVAKAPPEPALDGERGDFAERFAPMKLWDEVARRGGVHVGNSRDRNLRRLYRIEGR